MEIIRVGPAGSDTSFAENGYKSITQMPEYLSKIGLNAFEYQCGLGVRINNDNAVKFSKIAMEKDIAISLHAPYYISMSSTEEEKRLGSIKYIMQSAVAVKKLGGKRVIFHAGSCAKISRETALNLAKDTLIKAMLELSHNDINDIILVPETMGKINQLGTLEEVLELCKIDETIVPCVDFGHLNAREMGSLKTKEDYDKILKKIRDTLGEARLRTMHMHFSKIEYTAGGEKKHLTFEDDIFGPPFEPLGDLILKYSMTPTIICESDNTQTKDSLYMMNYLKNSK